MSFESKSHLLWFCITTLSDWLKNSRHFIIQSEVKKTPIVTHPRASYRLHVFASSFDWFSLQWNPVNKATNGPWKFGRINWVAVLTGYG